ncbi:MAG TPA: GNAT family N-acetyltransferase [Kofleriaceae bacterium]|jgi:GNAT superfamily N-acetyltransferase
MIRQATEHDVEHILRLYRAAGIEADGFTPDEARAHFATFARYPSYRLFVTDDLTGTYALLVMDNLAKRGARSAIVEDVAVDPAHQGRGIGRALMEHARAEAERAGCYKLVLSSNAARESAHRFYESLGFARHGVSFAITYGQANSGAIGEKL